MGYRSLKSCVDDLRKNGHLLVCDAEVDPNLEVAEIHRRVFASGGPAVFYANVRNCKFPLVSNLFGTMERVRFLFRDRWESVRRLIELRADPSHFLRDPLRYWRAPLVAWGMIPRRCRRGPVMCNSTTVSELPQIRSWPNDGGAFVLLPLVYSEDVRQPGLWRSNLGMYRIQISGNQYEPNQEIGLHYQLHRGIGIHHTLANRLGKPFRVNIFVGGAPAMTVAAVMPLPEGMSELTFAGALGGHRIPMIGQANHPAIYADADFCISGIVEPQKLLPEGPFGDHLGYYSLAHDFPVLRVERVYHRRDAIWPFTVVGRPPQEDTMFGQLIHELTGPMIPAVVPGVQAVHAVDAAGVHPLMLAIGSERYAPFLKEAIPRELLTQANAILGHGQMSLAKYLWIAALHDDPQLDVHAVQEFICHVLARVDWRRDVHFQTCTTIDTLDYSGTSLNQGSKVVVAAVGPPRRVLATEVPAGLPELPRDYHSAKICLPGVLAISGPRWSKGASCRDFCRHFEQADPALMGNLGLVVLADDSDFVSQSLNNFLWVTFTRSDPASDVDGIGASIHNKHWGCSGPLVIDARLKPHHAPVLEPDPNVVRRIDAMAARGGPLARYL
ncbi:MAG: UbiD family decarboxylase [Planctomycetota bacterium]|nr:UbiD family decarboxylase [Planctomycetota bacterium]MDA1178263.1 UbiD family decarboxylase [Planctomycetota bacterium]